MFDRQDYIKYDSPIKKILLKLFIKSDKLILFDVGACEGEESIRYKKIFPESLIFLFEPLPSNQQLIIQNIEKYKLEELTLVPVALSDEDSYTEFYTSSGQPDGIQTDLDWNFGNKSSSLLVPQIDNLPKWLVFKEKIQVQTMTLDFFLNKNKILEVDFLHMDVQGAELKVLSGAKEKIKDIKAIWLEVSNVELYINQPLSDEIEFFMKKNNFHLIKSEFSGEFGDQFYLNKKYFNIFSFFKGRVKFYLKKNNNYKN